eukprot:TRINITY_DN9703_c0_g1_i1.p1 TRINITY_DN9703_c0_g1~~TRINITY_DN9703_c0_g1_i1.p1  ORF type:complete len:241 (+),score=48.24 TRINITY_DN9703_c0_g1_i1:64-786(+)
MCIRDSFCKSEKCKKMSCTECLEEIERPPEDYDEYEEEKYGELEAKGGAVYHLECALYREDKEKWEKALADGGRMSCPQCGVGGRKDDACTHMTCEVCSTIWCYFCGKRESEVGGFSWHNDNWKEDETKCPLYFFEIQYYDERWPEDDESCQAFFHRIKTLSLLRKVLTEMGETRYKELAERYESIAKTGFKIGEIKNADLTLIQRQQCGHTLILLYYCQLTVQNRFVRCCAYLNTMSFK